MQTRFVVLSDTHFFAPGTRSQDQVFWNRVLQSRTDAIGAALVETVNALKPDFVIHCGDITGRCDLDHWAYACEVLDGLCCPWYAVLGNHDTWYPGVRDAFAARFELPNGQSCYRRDLAGMHLLFLDLAFWYEESGAISPYLDKDLYDCGQILGMGPSEEGLRWLEAQLEACVDGPVVLVSHPPLGFKRVYPVASLPKGQPVQVPSTSLVDLIGDVRQGTAIRELIEQHSNVKASFAGHWHIHDLVRQDGVVHCQTASLREFPFEIRVVQVRANALDVATVPLCDPGFSRVSYVAEWNNRWVAGNPADRTFRLKLE